MNVNGILGIVAAVLLLAVTILMGGPLETFVNGPALLIVIGLALGLQLIAYGGKAFQSVLAAANVLFGTPVAHATEPWCAENMRALALHFYVAGAVGLLAGWIQHLYFINSLQGIGPTFATSLLPLFYGMVLAECLARPAANRMDYLREIAGEEDPEASQRTTAA